MDKFQFVQTSFLELNKEWVFHATMNLFLFGLQTACIYLDKRKNVNINRYTIICICSYQEAIEEITRRMGVGMAKFIQKEVKENTSDHYIYISHFMEINCHLYVSVGWDRRRLWRVLSLCRGPCRSGPIQTFLCGRSWRSCFWFSFKLYGSLSSGNASALGPYLSGSFLHDWSFVVYFLCARVVVKYKTLKVIFQLVLPNLTLYFHLIFLFHWSDCKPQICRKQTSFETILKI
jgi:hypothetical protein